MQSIIRERIVEQLSSVPTLINRYASNDSAFVVDAFGWIQNCEQQLESFRLPLVSELSSIRGLMLACEDGYSDPQIIQSRSARKARRAMTMHLLQKAERVLRMHCQGIDQIFEEHREKLSQLLAVASSQKPFPITDNITSSYLDLVWRQTQESQKDPTLMQYVQARLSAVDRRYLLHDLVSHLLSAIEPEVANASQTVN